MAFFHRALRVPSLRGPLSPDPSLSGGDQVGLRAAVKSADADANEFRISFDVEK